MIRDIEKAKWLVTLKAEVKASSTREAREKAIGPFGNFDTCKIKLLEFKKMKNNASKKEEE